MYTIGAVCGDLQRSCSSAETCTRKMSGRQLRSYVESGSGGSSRGSSCQERRQKRHEDRKYEQGEEQSDLGEGSFQIHRTVSGTSRHEHFDRRDEELERLRRLVKDLELKAKGRRQKRNCEKCAEGSASVEGGYREASHRHRDRSREYAD